MIDKAIQLNVNEIPAPENDNGSVITPRHPCGFYFYFFAFFASSFSSVSISSTSLSSAANDARTASRLRIIRIHSFVQMSVWLDGGRTEKDEQ